MIEVKHFLLSLTGTSIGNSFYGSNFKTTISNVQILATEYLNACTPNRWCFFFFLHEVTLNIKFLTLLILKIYLIIFMSRLLIGLLFMFMFNLFSIILICRALP